MKNKTKVHDGIVGATILLSVVLGVKVDITWLWLAGIVSVLMIASAFTGFCPVYCILDKIMPGNDKEKCC